MIGKAREAMKTRQLHQVLNAVWAVVADANRYFAGEAPWALAKTDPVRQGTVLYTTAEVIRQVAILAQPFMPQAAARLLDLLAVPADRTRFRRAGRGRTHRRGINLPPPAPVFPRYVEPAQEAASEHARRQPLPSRFSRLRRRPRRDRRARRGGRGSAASCRSRRGCAQFDRLLAIAERFPNVYCSVGTHPHYAHEEPDVTAAGPGRTSTPSQGGGDRGGRARLSLRFQSARRPGDRRSAATSRRRGTPDCRS